MRGTPAVWLYFRFPLSLRLVEEMLLERRIVVISINGERRYLWRAVDQDGYVLDEIVELRRDAKGKGLTALTFGRVGMSAFRHKRKFELTHYQSRRDATRRLTGAPLRV